MILAIDPPHRQTCPIWEGLRRDTIDYGRSVVEGGSRFYSSRAGGPFRLLQDGADLLNEPYKKLLTDRQQANLSYWIYQHNLDNHLFDELSHEVLQDLQWFAHWMDERRHRAPELDQAWVESHRDLTPSAEDRRLTFLREMIRSDDANEEQPCEELLLAAGGCRHARDLRELRLNALDRGLLSGGGQDGPSYPHPGLIELDFDARIFVEERTRGLDMGRQGFVAMWFNPCMDEAYKEGICPAIWDAGYKPYKIDEDDFTGGVVDRILAEIRKSKFVVADFTSCDECQACEQCKHIGARGGVYFEAGFALGLDKTVFLTCREDRVEAIHFDINHLNRIQWKMPEDLREQLTNSIEAVLGHGPVERPDGQSTNGRQPEHTAA